MNAHAFQAALLADARRRADYLRAATPAMPDDAIDAVIWRRALQAGVDPSEYAPILAVRTTRSEGWDWRASLAVAQESLKPAPDRRSAGQVEATCTGIYDSRPRRYVWVVCGREMTVPSMAMTSRKQFLAACLDKISVVPELPSSKEWDDWIRAEIGGAEMIEEPEEASEDGAQKANVAETLRNLMQGESFDDLMAGKWVEQNCRKVVHMLALHREAKNLDQTLRPVDVSRSLRELGWTNETTRFGDDVVKVWVSPNVISPQKTASERIAMAGAARRLALVSGDDRPFFEDDIGGSHD